MNTVEPESVATSFLNWGLRLHTQAYRAVCNSIVRAAKTTVWYTTALSSVPIYRASRYIPLFDAPSVLAMRKINRVCKTVTGSPLIPEQEEIKTAAQKQHEQETDHLRRGFRANSVYPNFCSLTTAYIHVFLRRIIVELSDSLPPAAEKHLVYRMFRIVNSPWIKRLNFKEIRNQTVSAMDPEVLKTVMDFEHILLHFCQRLNDFARSYTAERGMEIAIRSLGRSLAQQKEIDLFLQEFGLNSPEERFIARIEWHKRNGTVPAGIPSEGLTRENLQGKLDISLKIYLEGKVEKLLEYLFPPSLKTGSAGYLYKQMGKDHLRNLLVYLIHQFGIKLITDPNCLSLAILRSQGEDVMEYDLHGFGRGQKRTVLDTGRQMILEAQNHGSRAQLGTLYKAANLQISPMGLEAILQRKETRARLQTCLSGIIYDMIKSDEEYKHSDEIFKGTREALGSIPVLGKVTTGLQLAIRGCLYSVGYLFKDKESTDSFPVWITKQLAGRKVTDYLAGRIVDLIHHPSWPITASTLIEALIVSVETPQGQPGSQPSGQPIREELHSIAEFLRGHFFDIPISMKQFSDKLDGTPFLQNLLPAMETVLEKALGSLQPTIKELLLIAKVLESFRKLERFDGDHKFWDWYVREALNQIVAQRFRTAPTPSTPPTLKEIAGVREQLLDQFLQMGMPDLWTALSQVTEYRDIKQWKVIPPRSEEEDERMLMRSWVDMPPPAILKL